jgi:hypothetical protein
VNSTCTGGVLDPSTIPSPDADRYQNYLIACPQSAPCPQDLRQTVPSLALPSRTSGSGANIAKSMSGATLATMGACERFHKRQTGRLCVAGASHSTCHSDTSDPGAMGDSQGARPHEVVQVHEAYDPPFVFEHRQRHDPVPLHNADGDGSELIGLGGPGRPSHHVGD